MESKDDSSVSSCSSFQSEFFGSHYWSDSSLDEEDSAEITNFQNLPVLEADSYRIQTPYQVLMDMEIYVRFLEEYYQMTESIIIQDLKECHWNYQKSMRLLSNRRYQKKQLEKEKAENNGEVEDKEKAENNSQEFNCSICFNVGSLNNASSFGCKHYCCKACFEDYIKAAINDDQAFKTCPVEKCEEIISSKLFVNHFGEDSMIYKRYLQLFLQSIVSESRKYLWCPNEKCTNIIELLKMKKKDKALGYIRCTCGYCFCFACRHLDHRPLKCDEFAVWKSKSQNPMVHAVKSCPECMTSIAKKQGALRMTCRNCLNKFCSICMKSWEEHSTRVCNSFKPLKNSDNTDQQKEFESFCLERFEQHLHSTILAKNKKQLVLENFKLLNDESVRKVEPCFLAEALDLTIEARRALSMTYAVFACQKSTGRQVDIYELQQSLLWAALDNLDKFTDRLEVTDKMKSILCYPIYEDFWPEHVENFKDELKAKVEAVENILNKLLKSMEEEDMTVKEAQLENNSAELDEEFKKHEAYAEWFWYCEVNVDCPRFKAKFTKQ